MYLEQKVADLRQRVEWLETILRTRCRDVPLFSCDVKRMVADFYHVKIEDFDNKHRTAKLAWARQVAMTLCYQMCRLSLGEVGREFGMRDHGTVLHAVKHVKDRCETDAKVRAEVQRIKEALGVSVTDASPSTAPL